MVGARDSISSCNVVLNTITAQAFKEACDRLEAAPDFSLAVHDLIKEYATEHQRIVFNGKRLRSGMGRRGEAQRPSKSSLHGGRHSGAYHRESSGAF